MLAPPNQKQNRAKTRKCTSKAAFFSEVALKFNLLQCNDFHYNSKKFEKKINFQSKYLQLQISALLPPFKQRHFSLKLFGPVVTTLTTSCNTQNVSFLTTDSIVRASYGYHKNQRLFSYTALTGFYNRNFVWLLQGKNWFFKYYHVKIWLWSVNGFRTLSYQRR
jgi:hypothetical protein